MCSWNKEKTLALLDYHSSMECLYNGKHYDYLNKKRKNECWKEIVNYMQELRPGTTLQEVKLEIKILRSQFLLEERKIKKSQLNATDMDNAYTPKLWCYQNLKYLANRNDSTFGVETNVSSLIKSDKESSASLLNIAPLT